MQEGHFMNDRRKCKLFCSVILLWAIISAMLAGCIPRTPSRKEVIRQFQCDKPYLEKIVNYLINLPYDSIVIWPKGSREEDKEQWQMFADFDYVPIPEEIKHEVDYLLNKHNHYTVFSKYVTGPERNIIKFGMTRGTVHLSDVYTGVVYAIDNGQPPVLECVTVLEQIDDSGWYYYVCDYNAFRPQKKTGDGSLS